MLRESGLELEEKDSFVDERHHIRFKHLSDEEKNELIKKTPLTAELFAAAKQLRRAKL